MNFFSLGKVKLKVNDKNTRTMLLEMRCNISMDYFEQIFTHWVSVTHLMINKLSAANYANKLS